MKEVISVYYEGTGVVLNLSKIKYVIYLKTPLIEIHLSDEGHPLNFRGGLATAIWEALKDLGEDIGALKARCEMLRQEKDICRDQIGALLDEVSRLQDELMERSRC